MTAKEYLEQALRLDRQIDSKQEVLDNLNLQARRQTSVLSAAPGGSGSNKRSMADTVDKIVDLQREINEDIDQLVEFKTQLYRAIGQVSNKEYRLLLEQRYLCDKSWQDIADDLDITLRNTYYLTDKAIAAVEPFLPINASKTDVL